MTRCTTAAANCAKPGTPEKRSGHALRSKPNLYVQLKQTDPLQCFRSLTSIPRQTPVTQILVCVESNFEGIFGEEATQNVFRFQANASMS